MNDFLAVPPKTILERELTNPASPARAALTATILDKVAAPISAAIEALPPATANPALGSLYAALATRNVRPVVLVGAGSSTVAGSSATSAANRWINRFAASLQARYPLTGGAAQPATRTLAEAVATPPSSNGIQMINAGVSGMKSNDYLTTTTGPQVAALNPDAIFHMVGSNDFHGDVPIATYKANLEARLDQLDAGAAKPILHVLIHQYERADAAVTTGTLHTWAEYRDAMKAIATARPNNVAFIDLSPFYYKAGVPGPDPYVLMHSDKIHQIDAGHAMMADLVLRLLGISDMPTIAAAGTVVPAVSPSRWTSDTFSTDGALAGRVTDAALGGAAKTFSAALAFTITGGVLVASGDATTHMTGLLLPSNVDFQASIVLNAMPTAGGVYLDLYRDTLSTTPTSYRLAFSSTSGVTLGKQVTGTYTTLASLGMTAATGKRIAIRYFRGVLSALIDGVTVASVPDTSITRAGYVGFSKSSTGTAFSIDDFAVDILV